MSVFKNYFFHDLTRKYQLVFGSLFQDIQIKRMDESGKALNMITVPIIHSPKEKFIQRLEGDIEPENYETLEKGGTRRRTALSLPIIAYEMVDLQYDGQRKIAKNQYIRSRLAVTDDLSNKLYTPAPYILTYEVNIVTKTQNEMLQIIEQIIPAFTPDVNITLKGIPGVEFDVPITFTGVFRNDTYTGAFEERRQIMWTLNFTMKSYYFTPLDKKKIILNVTAPIFHLKDSDDLEAAELIETFTASESDLIGQWTESDD